MLGYDLREKNTTIIGTALIYVIDKRILTMFIKNCKHSNKFELEATVSKYQFDQVSNFSYIDNLNIKRRFLLCKLYRNKLIVSENLLFTTRAWPFALRNWWFLVKMMFATNHIKNFYFKTFLIA